MIVLLRTLTEKSIIGFGQYKNTTVGNLLAMKDYRGLLSIYYNLARVTFSENILQQLYLNDPEFKIEKPGKSKEAYVKYADMILVNLEVHNNVSTEVQINEGKHRNLLNPKKRRSAINNIKNMSKMLNKISIQRGVLI